MSLRADLALHLIGLVLALVVYGCGDHTRTRTFLVEVPASDDTVGTTAVVTIVDEPWQAGDPAPSVTTLTPGGVTLVHPTWLQGAALAGVLEELATTESEADPRGTRVGVPAGYVVEIPCAGPYWRPDGSMAIGEWLGPGRLRVAYRGSEREPKRLPALAHELRHDFTNDPTAGH